MNTIQQQTLIMYAAPAAAGAALIAFRFIYLNFVVKLNAIAFMSQVIKLVQANNTDRAIKLCNAAPSAILPQLTKMLLEESQQAPVERTDFYARALPLLHKAAYRFSITNILSLLGAGVSAWLFMQKGLHLQKAFLIPSGIVLYLNFSTTFSAIMITKVSHKMLERLIVTMEQKQEKEEQRRDDTYTSKKGHKAEDSRFEASFDIGAEEEGDSHKARGGSARKNQEDSRFEASFDIGAEEEGESGRATPAGGSRETPVKCSFCGADKPVRSGYEGNLTAFNIDDWVEGPCPKCGSELFALK